MLKVGDNYYRNLEEQVLKNKQDIANHYNVDRVLADFGITIVGHVDIKEDLPDPEEYTGNYGDGYYVGTKEPYSFFIFTRPDPDTGYDTNYWLDVGPLAIAGPEGPKGDRGPAGPTGPRGSLWTSVYDTLPQTTNYKVNDQVLRTYDGNIYECRLNADENKYWALIGNIQGPQGIQGIQGEQGLQGPQGPQGPTGPIGPTGKSITIIGEVSNASQLPDPSTVDRASAYLVTVGDSKHIFLITGTDTLVWTDAGGFGGGSTILVNGAIVNEFNADTKLDKVTIANTSSKLRLYAINADGSQTVVDASTIRNGHEIPRYTGGGQLDVSTPKSEYQAANKLYVDTAVGAKLDKVSGTTSNNQVYGKTADGTQTMYDISDSALSGGIVQRQPDGSIYCNTPTNEEDAANKGYVDEQTANLQPKLTAGTNITISNNTISAKDTTYTAGTNITISNNKISAKNTTYTAGSGISISSSNVISATAVSQPKVKQWLVRVFAYISSDKGYFEAFFNVLVKDGTTANTTNLLAALNKMGATSSTFLHSATGAVGEVRKMKNKIIGVYYVNSTTLGIAYDGNDNVNAAGILTQNITLDSNNTTIKVYDPTA